MQSWVCNLLRLDCFHFIEFSGDSSDCCIYQVSFFLFLRVAFHGMDTTVCLTTEGHLECSEFGTLMNKMLRSLTYQFLQECTFSFSGPRNEQIVGTQLPVHMAVACLVFKEIAKYTAYAPVTIVKTIAVIICIVKSCKRLVENTLKALNNP